MSDLLLHGSMVLVFAWLVIGGLGLPLPEDVALLATGALIHYGSVAPAVALAVVYVGAITGDAMLFFLARRLGPAAYNRPVVRRLLPPARRLRIEDAYRKYGGRLIFFARHVAGLRAAAFTMAGIHGMQPRRFLFWDALAASISVPLVVGVGYLAAFHLDKVSAGVATARHYVVLVLIIGLIGYMTVHQVRPWRADRRARTSDQGRAT
jgi:membrane protein DedA with SNARE-associated domain